MTVSAPPPPADTKLGTVEFLLRRMEHSRDFPALSETIRTLNRMAASQEKSVEQLAAVIVRDYALANKILKVVNSAYYAGFAGKVGTISRAIVVLGIEPIRALAASLILFEHLNDGNNTARVKALIGKSMFGALLARESAAAVGLAQHEEAFLAAMFHDLGELLVAFYLPEEDQAVQAAVAAGADSFAQAQFKVLGLTFEQLGIAVGKHWNFPETITHSMKKVTQGKPAESASTEETLRQLACFACEATAQLAAGAAPDGAAVTALFERFGDCVTYDRERFAEVLGHTRSEYRQLAEGLAAPESAPAAIRALAGPPRPEVAVASDDEIAAVSLPDEVNDAPADKPAAPEPILLEGLQEATTMLAEGSDLNPLAQVVLETLYRAFALRRVALCLRDPARRRYAGRLGFGSDIDAYLRALQFGEAYERDLFHAALEKRSDVHIADLGAAGTGHAIPAWYKAVSPTGSLLLLPLIVQGRAVGCIVAEHDRPNGLPLDGGTLRLVRALRNQLVLGFQLRSGGRA